MLLRINPGHEPGPNDAPHAFRGTVPPHEKLLLLAILVVVAAWIMLRVGLVLSGTLG